MLRNWTRGGGLTHLPSFHSPWCWRAIGPRALTACRSACAMTVSPFSPSGRLPSSVGRCHLHGLPVEPLLLRPVGLDDGDVGVDIGRLLDPPLDPEDEVAELLLGPEALVAGGLAARVDVDDPAHDLPVPVVADGDLPAGEVAAVEERDEAVGGGRHATAAQGGGTKESESNGLAQRTINAGHQW